MSIKHDCKSSRITFKQKVTVIICTSSDSEVQEVVSRCLPSQKFGQLKVVLSSPLFVHKEESSISEGGVPCLRTRSSPDQEVHRSLHRSFVVDGPCFWSLLLEFPPFPLNLPTSACLEWPTTLHLTIFKFRGGHRCRPELAAGCRQTIPMMSR